MLGFRPCQVRLVFCQTQGRPAPDRGSRRREVGFAAAPSSRLPSQLREYGYFSAAAPRRPRLPCNQFLHAMLVRAFPPGLQDVRGEAACRSLPILVRRQEYATKSPLARRPVPICLLQSRSRTARARSASAASALAARLPSLSRAARSSPSLARRLPRRLSLVRA